MARDFQAFRSGVGDVPVNKRNPQLPRGFIVSDNSINAMIAEHSFKFLSWDYSLCDMSFHKEYVSKSYF